MLSRQDILLQHCQDLHEKDNLVKIMEKIDPERAEKIKDCGRFVKLYEDTNTGRVWKEYNGYTCGDRFCPICQRRRSRKLCRRAAEKLDGYIKDHSKAYVVNWTFSPVENCNITELRWVFSCFSKFLHALLTEPRSPFPVPEGYIRSYEFTYNKEEDTYHPHIHVLCVYPEYVYFDKDAINKFIIKVMSRKSLGSRNSAGICKFTVMRNCKSDNRDSFDISTEAVKYVTKFNEITDEYQLASLIGAIKGLQTICFCGFMGWSKEDEEAYQQRKIEQFYEATENPNFVQSSYFFSRVIGGYFGYYPLDIDLYYNSPEYNKSDTVTDNSDPPNHKIPVQSSDTVYIQQIIKWN